MFLTSRLDRCRPLPARPLPARPLPTRPLPTRPLLDCTEQLTRQEQTLHKSHTKMSNFINTEQFLHSIAFGLRKNMKTYLDNMSEFERMLWLAHYVDSRTNSANYVHTGVFLPELPAKKCMSYFICKGVCERSYHGQCKACLKGTP